MRKPIIFILAALMIVGLAGGAYMVYKRGLKRKGLAERAHQAYMAKDYKAARRLAKQLHEGDPDSGSAYEILCRVAHADGRWEDLEAIARKWSERYPANRLAAEFLLESVRRTSHPGAVYEEALKLVPHHPDLALTRMIDLVGSSPRMQHRLQAAEFAVSLATIIKSNAMRAAALHLAALTQYEAARFYSTGPAKAIWAHRARDNQNGAAGFIEMALQGKEHYGLEYLKSNIQLLSESEEDRESARAFIEKALAAAVTDLEIRALDRARVSLAFYYLTESSDPDALTRAEDLATELRKATNYFPRWFSTVRWMFAAGHLDKALELAEAEPQPPEPVALTFLRAEIRMRKSDKESKKQAYEILKELVTRENTPPETTRRAFAILAIGGDLAASLQILDDAGVPDRQRRIASWIAAEFSDKLDPAQRIEAVEGMAEETKNFGESLLVMRQLARQDPARLIVYLDRKISLGGDGIPGHLLLRAQARLVMANRAADGEKQPFVDAARADLVTLDQTAKPDARVRIGAAQLAQQMKDPELAGRLFAPVLRAGAPAYVLLERLPMCSC